VAVRVLRLAAVGEGDVPQLLVTAFIPSGCRNKLSLTGWLLKNGLHGVGGWEVQDQGRGMVAFRGGPPSWFTAGAFLLSPHVV